VLGHVAVAEGDEVLEGVLLCSEAHCQREHPIIDGIPVVVADIASWASHQIGGVLGRDDLSAYTESLLGDATGPASEFHRDRSNLGIYGWAHWGDFAPPGDRQHGGAYAALLAHALDLADAQPSGLWLDLGCSVGRGTLELARRGVALAVGVDLNFAMLRVAERVRRQGQVRFPLRRGGVVFERFSAAAPDGPATRLAHTSHWCCDVSMLPFADARFDGALLLNLLDCVPDPLALLFETGRVVAPGGQALFSSPYDWSANATPMAQWLGGHSQRSPSGGSSVAEVRRILSADRAAGVDTGLVIEAERDAVPWHVQTGERSTMAYSVHMARLRRS
jgi:SAM-dependent methyltransferase